MTCLCQIVKGIRYIVDLEISRTVCRKRDGNNNLSHCDFQPPGRLQQVSVTSQQEVFIMKLLQLCNNCKIITVVI